MSSTRIVVYDPTKLIDQAFDTALRVDPTYSAALPRIHGLHDWRSQIAAIDRPTRHVIEGSTPERTMRYHWTRPPQRHAGQIWSGSGGSPRRAVVPRNSSQGAEPGAAGGGDGAIRVRQLSSEGVPITD